MLYLYFKHSTLTREETARSLNISLTSTNKLIGECNELLREFNLEIKQTDLIILNDAQLRPEFFFGICFETMVRNNEFS